MGESRIHDGEQENQSQRSTDDLVYSILTKCKNNQHGSLVTEVRKVAIFEGGEQIGVSEVWLMFLRLAAA